MTSTQAPITYVHDLGVTAFHAGLPCAPALDPALTERLGAVGTSAAIMRQWISGWTTANLAAPVD